MRFFISALVLFAASSSFAANSCDKWLSNPTFVKAITTVAATKNLSFDELCALPTVWDVEAQPSHIFNRDGERIPFTRVQLHGEYDSCLYMVRVADQAITEQRCYSGF